MGTGFPPGYRFAPTDEEIVVHYLDKKVAKFPLPRNTILEIQLYDDTPENIFEEHNISRDKELYLFTSREKKYPNGNRPKLDAGDKMGFWKPTGASRDVVSKQRTVGYKRSLVFFMGPRDKPVKTNWRMYEYRLKNCGAPKAYDGNMLDECVLCKLYEIKPSATDQKMLMDYDQIQGENVSPELVHVDSENDNAHAIKYHEENNALAVQNHGGQSVQLPTSQVALVNNDNPMDSPGDITLDEIVMYMEDSSQPPDGEGVAYVDPEPSSKNHIIPNPNLRDMTLDEFLFQFNVSDSTSYGQYQNQDKTLIAQGQPLLLPYPYTQTAQGSGFNDFYDPRLFHSGPSTRVVDYQVVASPSVVGKNRANGVVSHGGSINRVPW